MWLTLDSVDSTRDTAKWQIEGIGSSNGMVKIKIAGPRRSSGNTAVTAIAVSGIPNFFVFLAPGGTPSAVREGNRGLTSVTSVTCAMCAMCAMGGSAIRFIAAGQSSRPRPARRPLQRDRHRADVTGTARRSPTCSNRARLRPPFRSEPFAGGGGSAPP
ncbi:hypothetical protein [Streptomyces anulatus]|uniref:hypothetical protein n=1 Tax=Streptomyces anulatus TaxID=1892 RepID=UPI00344AB90D